MTCKYKFFGDWAKEYDPNEHRVSQETTTRTRQRERNVRVAEYPRDSLGRFTSRQQESTRAEGLTTDNPVGLYGDLDSIFEELEGIEPSESNSSSERQTSLQEIVNRVYSEFNSRNRNQPRWGYPGVPGNSPASETRARSQLVEDQQSDTSSGDFESEF